jgi:hypothetical protein
MVVVLTTTPDIALGLEQVAIYITTSVIRY